MIQDKEREALEAAWSECRDACDPSDWTASEAAAYRGFFAHGYRAALATQPPAVQGEPLTDDAILDAFCHTPGIHQFVQAFKAGARFAERAHGIHSRGEGEKV